MKKLISSLAAMIIVAIVIIMFLGCDNTKKQSKTKDQLTTTTVSTTTDVTTETSVTTSVTSATTTATTTVATTEYMEEEPVLVEIREESIEETVEEYIPTTEEYQQTTYTETETVTIPVTEEETYCEETQSNMTINYSINQLTYYSGPKGCKGRWSRTLLNNYSIASNLLPDGTIVHIESNDGSINGDYRVDDTGGMGNNVIDIFYTNYSNVPYPFSRDGRISCTVWVYE